MRVSRRCFAPVQPGQLQDPRASKAIGHSSDRAWECGRGLDYAACGARGLKKKGCANPAGPEKLMPLPSGDRPGPSPAPLPSLATTHRGFHSQMPGEAAACAAPTRARATRNRMMG